MIEPQRRTRKWDKYQSDSKAFSEHFIFYTIFIDLWWRDLASLQTEPKLTQRRIKWCVTSMHWLASLRTQILYSNCTAFPAACKICPCLINLCWQTSAERSPFDASENIGLRPRVSRICEQLNSTVWAFVRQSVFLFMWKCETVRVPRHHWLSRAHTAHTHTQLNPAETCSLLFLLFSFLHIRCRCVRSSNVLNWFYILPMDRLHSWQTARNGERRAHDANMHRWWSNCDGWTPTFQIQL